MNPQHRARAINIVHSGDVSVSGEKSLIRIVFQELVASHNAYQNDDQRTEQDEEEEE